MRDTEKAAIAVGLAVAGVITLVSLAKAGPPPPTQYTCPYCGQTFDTLQELETHVSQDHPTERIPIDIEWD